jgi:hypothetical protein
VARLIALVVWRKPTSIRSADRRTCNAPPGSITAREARSRVERAGLRTRWIAVVTTRLGPGRAGEEGPASPYRAGWDNGLDPRSIEAVPRMDGPRCKAPELVREEIWAHAPAYDPIRTVMARAAAGEGAAPRAIGLKATLRAPEASRPVITARAGRGAGHPAALHERLLRAIAVHRAADRPDRLGPRMTEKGPRGIRARRGRGKRSSSRCSNEPAKSKCHSCRRPIQPASANRRRQHGHSLPLPRTEAWNAVGCGSVMIARNASGARWA